MIVITFLKTKQKDGDRTEGNIIEILSTLVKDYFIGLSLGVSILLTLCSKQKLDQNIALAQDMRFKRITNNNYSQTRL